MGAIVLLLVASACAVRLPCSVRCPAAVYGYRAAGDAGGSLRAEKGDVGGHLVWLQQAVDRRLSDHDLLHHLVFGDAVQLRLAGDLLLDEGRPHVGGADAVAGPLVLRALQRRDTRQAEQAVLGGHVGGLIGGGAQRVDRAYVDDTSPAALVHARQRRLGQQEG